MALGAAVTVLAAACSGPSHAASRTSDARPLPIDRLGTRLDSALPASVLRLPFTASDGRTVRLSDLAGRSVVVSDAMTLCQETCPLDTATLVQTARAEDSAGVGPDETFLSITVDPGRDTRTQLAAYRRLYSPPPANWIALTGSPATVDALWAYLGVWRAKVAEPTGPPPRNWRTGQPLAYDVQHSDELFFLDRHGHERFVLEGPPYAARASLPKALYDFMNARGRQNVSHPSEGAWTQSQAQQVLSWLRR
ncbi:hypothetical protein GCM10009868_21870 [Terrabacter aerolatus]|uniref:Cytochrome-c oxidase n=1 Tax=Terrabacter aerolatus TaxID=422442 RepID=A0A512D4E2_9MICO|nr:SCO family protein [Terrabacter aerolatus]GEO31343.1 cytochrome-c oxidase [Terrabacter aerolatus]